MLVVQKWVDICRQKSKRISLLISAHSSQLNGRPLSGNSPLTIKKSLADAKSLSPCNKYPEDRTRKPNAVINARQGGRPGYHHRAKELDSGFGGGSSGSFDAELSS